MPLQGMKILRAMSGISQVGSDSYTLRHILQLELEKNKGEMSP